AVQVECGSHAAFRARSPARGDSRPAGRKAFFHAITHPRALKFALRQRICFNFLVLSDEMRISVHKILPSLGIGDRSERSVGRTLSIRRLEVDPGRAASFP